VIFVHGCFWHSHTCTKAHVPRSNKEYWQVKLSRNRQRDSKNLRTLTSAGWSALVIWECEIANAQALCTQIRRFLQDDT
jgi:DNA mismatch endonuclease (patch repair protein)